MSTLLFRPFDLRGLTLPNRFARTHVVGLGRLRRKTHLDIAQALPAGHWSERHDSELSGTGKVHCVNFLEQETRNDKAHG